MNIGMPSGARLIIERLELNGYRADIVGGCVRDAMLGRVADDFDITTSAPPDTTARIFSDMRVIETGIAHGTLTVIADSVPYEVTTWRVDGEYTDSRHPDSVSFASDISEDLARRDFTVNAMAYSERYGLTDPFGGLSDIERRIVRAVGDPYKRFTEDALRILRAIRFSSVLGFEIDSATSSALLELAPRLCAVSKERIYTEWHKLLRGKGAYSVIPEYRSVIECFLPELKDLCMPPREGFDSVGADARMLALFYSTLGESAPDAFNRACIRLKTDKKTRELGALALKNIERPVSARSDAVLLLSEIGDAAQLLLEARRALSMPTVGGAELIDLIKSDGTVYRVSDLALDGTDLVGVGAVGKKIGETLSHLLRLVITDNLPNEREALLAEAQKYLQN